jgi:nicotinamide riboside kinase
MSIRIAFTGPESSGKSTYAQWASEHFPNTLLVCEYARVYLESVGKSRASQKDFQHIVETSINQFQKSYIQDLIVFDGDQFVLEVWNEWEFNIPLPSTQFECDLKFLCYPDLPWEADQLRSLPNEKDRILVFEQIEKKLLESKANYTVLRGSREQKEAMIIASINSLIK